MFQIERLAIIPGDELYESIGPLVLQNNPHSFHYATVHYRPKQSERITTFIENIAEKFIDIQPLEIQFYEDLEEAENNILREFVMISVWCCGFIIYIALMGLLGMTRYISEMRVKEIGIRKVPGASIPDLSYLLAKEYIILLRKE